MGDLLSHPLFVSLISLLIGTLIGAVLTRLQNKTAELTWSSRFDRIALAADDQIFGSVRVSWGSQAVRNLYLVTLVIENASNRDFEDVGLRVFTGDETVLLTEATGVDGKPYIVEWSDTFRQTLAVSQGAVATADQIRTYNHSREYMVPVLNRGERLRLTYLCTRPNDDQQPVVLVSTQLKGAQMIYKRESALIWGAPIKHAAVRGAVISFVVYLLSSYFVRNVWIAGSIILSVASFAQMLGAYQFRLERWFWRVIAG